ncbi:sperm-egg fusion protein TMEM95 isoform X1 [Trichechus manatus latirostris]|uniref:Sperm-egg fusion protein TMEM95 isoform X1 n=1 Tax=Trichechus manatus latirostris TaxID=127582 RepID=A0A2Y9QZX0_TRIMA|nr:sperm-egg fusion protein TMEM95 isoform X1 [Trichechus manatus latirostris]
MWMLVLGGVFLAAAQACVFCRLPAHDLLGRLDQICSQMEVQWEACEASQDFSAFALDEVSMNKITEKTHRVLRVMEIKGSFSSLPLYWEWLHNTKIPEYTREALCAPACPRVLLSPAGGSTTLYNCSTCEGVDVHCWSRKQCFPGSHDLWEARILLFSVFVAVLLLSVLSLVVESRSLQAKSGL